MSSMMYEIGDIVANTKEKYVFAGYNKINLSRSLSGTVGIYQLVFDRKFDMITRTLLPSFFTLDMKDLTQEIAFGLEYFVKYPFTSGLPSKVMLLGDTVKVGHIDFTIPKYLLATIENVLYQQDKYKEELLKFNTMLITKKQFEKEVEKELKPFLKKYKENFSKLYVYYVNLMIEQGYLVGTTENDTILYLYQNNIWYKGYLEGNEFYYVAKSKNIFSLFRFYEYRTKKTEEIDVIGKCYEYNDL